MTQESHSWTPSLLQLDDIIAYLQCPLKARYRAWGTKEQVIDVREAVRISSETAIGAYLREGAKPAASKERSLRAAVQAYKVKLTQFDQEGMFQGDMYFAQHFNAGLVLIKRFHDHAVDHRRDRIVHGPHEFSYPIGDSFILSKVAGLISFNEHSREEKRFGVVVVSPTEKVRTTWSRVREGFCYGAVRRALDGLRTFPLSVVQVDPFEKTVKEYSISLRDQARFDALASVAVAGMRHEVYPPQPSVANCSRCSYRKACDVKYAKPERVDWHKYEFLEKMK